MARDRRRAILRLPPGGHAAPTGGRARTVRGRPLRVSPAVGAPDTGRSPARRPQHSRQLPIPNIEVTRHARYEIDAPWVAMSVDEARTSCTWTRAVWSRTRRSRQRLQTAAEQAQKRLPRRVDGKAPARYVGSQRWKRRGNDRVKLGEKRPSGRSRRTCSNPHRHAVQAVRRN